MTDELIKIMRAIETVDPLLGAATIAIFALMLIIKMVPDRATRKWAVRGCLIVLLIAVLLTMFKAVSAHAATPEIAFDLSDQRVVYAFHDMVRNGKIRQLTQEEHAGAKSDCDGLEYPIGVVPPGNLLCFKGVQNMQLQEKLIWCAVMILVYVRSDRQIIYCEPYVEKINA